MADFVIDYERLTDLLAPKVAELLREPEYADAKRNPLRSERAFLDAGRRGDFPTFKRCREVVAKWGDVEAYIKSRKVVPRTRTATPANDGLDAEALLDEVTAKSPTRRAGGRR